MLCCKLVFYKIRLFSPNWNVNKVSKVARKFCKSFQSKDQELICGDYKSSEKVNRKNFENTNFEIFRKHEDTGSFLVFNWMKTSLIIFFKNTYLYNFLYFYLYCQTLPIPFKQLPIVRIKPLPYPKYRNSVLNMNPFQFIIEKFAIQIPVWM